MRASRRHVLQGAALAAASLAAAGCAPRRPRQYAGQEPPMTSITYPPPLRPGDTIGVTAPSAGVGPDLETRLQFCYRTLRDMGYRVREGRCLRGDRMVSAPAADRARELAGMLLDDAVRAVVPPWGGELLIDILPLLDFGALAAARPKWIVGYSDLATFMLPYTLLTRVATAHGSNLLETPIRLPGEPLAHWTEVAALPPGASFAQGPAASYQVDSFDWRQMPEANRFNCAQSVQWKRLGREDDPGYAATVSGRLIGGCLDVVGMLAGSPYGDLNAFARACAPEGLLVYLENCDGNTAQYARMLHHLRLAGWFERANAVLLGRSAGPQLREYTARDAIVGALGGLPIPVFYDLDIGHLPPQMMLVNGARAEFAFGPAGCRLTQTLA
jgi:muramoyltetrapeptide carboxypeptidase LdcA involved in peptidoglycan recycling